MKVAEEVAGLSLRVDRLSQRVDRFEAKVDARFEGVDQRFDELKRHFDVIAEASRDDFRNLYDLFQVHMQRMEGRMDTLAVTLRSEMKLGDDALDRRVTVLEQREQPRGRRTRR